MSQIASALRQHLLTRADLAELEIPAAEILRWLAEGWVEIVGTFPLGDDGSPVLAVPSRALARELGERMRGLGRDAVVFAPLRVRSMLARALLALEPPGVPFAGGARGTQDAGEGTLSVEEIDEITRAVTDIRTYLADMREEARHDDENLPGGDEEESGLGDASPDFFDFENLSAALDEWVEETEGLAPEEDGGKEPDEDEHEECEMTDDETRTEETETPPEAGKPVTESAAGEKEEDEVRNEVQDEQGIVDPEVAANLAYDAEEAEAEAQPESEPEPEPPSDETTDQTTDEPIVEPEAAAMLAEEPEPTADPSEVEEPEPEPEPPSDETTDQTTDDPIVEPEAAAMLAEEPEPTANPSEVEEPEPEPEPPSDEPVAAAALEKVESFLGELRGTLVELARKSPEAPPAPPPAVDIEPLVAAVGEFGQRVEHGVAVGVHAALNSDPRPATATAVPLPAAPPSSTNLVLLAVTILLMGWAAVFWFKTGNMQLTLGTVIGANVVGCCLLLGRRR